MNNQTKADSPPLWIKDPLAILADGAPRGIVVQGGRIVELVPAGGEPATRGVKILDAAERVVLPGLINTHHHFYQTLTRAVPAALDRELFPWLHALYPLWARLTPEALDLAATLATAELLLSGATLTTDHHYVFPEGLEDALDIEVAAASRLGVRVLLTRGSMNLSQRDGGLPPDSVVQDEDTILADCERVVKRQHPPCRDRRRKPLLQRALQMPPARLSGRLRMARGTNLARARHSFHPG
jgi:8-oxoguanine deaminase